MTLDEIRNDWEKGYKAECVIHNPAAGSVLVVLSKKAKDFEIITYACHRYFPIGENWEVSVDKRAVTDVSQCFSWLESCFWK